MGTSDQLKPGHLVIYRWQIDFGILTSSSDGAAASIAPATTTITDIDITYC